MAELLDKFPAQENVEGLSDEELLRRFAQGDRSALVELLGRYERPLFNYLARLLGDATAAEDAYQEVCLRLLRSAGTYDPSRPARPWLYAIATNVCRRHGAKRTSRRALALDSTEDDEAVGRLHDLPAEGPEPGEVVEQRELAGLVGQAVKSLPEHQREVVLLYQYQGLKYGEISRIVGRPLGTVKSDMFYALRTLRRRLERYRR